MAKRVKLDFKEVELPVDKVLTVKDIMPSESRSVTVLQQNAEGVYVPVEVISRSDAHNRKVLDKSNYITNQSDMIKASVKTEFLIKDLTHFFRTINVKNPEIYFNGEDAEENPDYIQFINFPLPPSFTGEDGINRTYRSKSEEVVVIIRDYPQFGPWGIHIKQNSINRSNIKEALDGHIFGRMINVPDNYTATSEELEKIGWEWICFHFKDNNGKWKFNIRNISQGDCLAKYFINLYAALGGKY